jgi:4-diphosphocytidyl-2-C-methyl-D-erythritol kinase
VSAAAAPAKINLALVVGPRNADGLHEVATVLQRIALCDQISLEPAQRLAVEGFEEDTIVTGALQALAAAGGVEPCWRARIEKRIPVAAGLGGGSSDAATALRLANDLLPEPFPHAALHAIARGLGADVPFFLESGPQLGTGDGSTLQPLRLPQDYTVLLVRPAGAVKESTGAVYARFDRADGFAERRARLRELVAGAPRALDLAELPPNDLASSPVAAELRVAGAFRADVSGAGPTVYGLFADRAQAVRAARELDRLGRTWIADPAW